MLHRGFEPWKFLGVSPATRDDVKTSEIIRSALTDPEQGPPLVTLGEPLARFQLKEGCTRAMRKTELADYYGTIANNVEEKGHQIPAVTFAVQSMGLALNA